MAQAVSRATSGHSQTPEHGTRQALEDLMGPESIVTASLLRLDILPCDGQRVPERYRVMFSGDPTLIEPPGDHT